MFGFLRRRRDEREEPWTQGPDLLQDAIQALPKPPKVKKRVHWADSIIQQLYFSKESSEEDDDEDEEEDEVDSEEEVEKKMEEKKNEDIKCIEEKKMDERKPSMEKELDVKSLMSRVSDMDRDLVAKSCLIDRLQKELKEAYAEAESRGRLYAMETTPSTLTALLTTSPSSNSSTSNGTMSPPLVIPDCVPIQASSSSVGTSLKEPEVPESSSEEEEDEDEDAEEEEESEEESDEEENKDSEKDDSEEENDESKQRLEELNRTNAELNRQNVELNRANTELSRNNAELRTRVSELSKKELELERKLVEAEERIHQLEDELKKVLKGKEVIELSLRTLQDNKDEEIKTMQKAFDDAVAEQEIMINKFSSDFEELRTLNASREQKLLEDFEWKLREVEKGCKKRLEQRDKDRETLVIELTEKLSSAEEQLKDVPRLKAIETEFDQTRASNSELKRNLRMTTRKLEELQVSEKVLQEETTRLRSAVDKEKSFVANLQIVHREELDERERKLNFKLNVQKTSLTMLWEDKLKHEIVRVKEELERRLHDERQAAAETARHLKDKEIQELHAQWDRKVQSFHKQIEDLEMKLSDKEDEKREDLENAQTRSDKELIELRRQLDKLYMSSEDRIEKLQEKHDQQFSEAEEEWTRRIGKLEAETEAAKHVAEEAKQKAATEAQAAIHQLQLHQQHRLEEQYERLTKEKDEALRCQEARFKSTVRQLEMEMAALARCAPPIQDGRSGSLGAGASMSPTRDTDPSKDALPEDSQQSPRLSENAALNHPISCDRGVTKEMSGAVRVYPQIIKVFPANIVQEVSESREQSEISVCSDKQSEISKAQGDTDSEQESEYEEANDASRSEALIETVVSKVENHINTVIQPISNVEIEKEQLKSKIEVVQAQPDLIKHSTNIDSNITKEEQFKVASPNLVLPECPKEANQKKQQNYQQQKQQQPNRGKRSRKSRNRRR